MAKEAVLIAYGRSAIGKAVKGSLRATHPVDYAGQVLKGVLYQIPQLNWKEIDDVVVGCAMPEFKQGFNVSRLIACRAGIPEDVPTQTINRFCSSGLQSIATAANQILAGQSEVVVAGGVETMHAGSLSDHVPSRSAWILKNAAEMYTTMGITAENVAKQYGVTRQDMDAFATESHRRSSTASESGYFKKEIIPVTAVDEEGNTFTFAADEGFRKGVSAEKLATLLPAFLENGTVTAGNASQLSDAAAFVVLTTPEKAAQLGIAPIARFVGFAVAGVPPEIMGIGPIKAVPKVMKLTGLTMDDMDVVELNEAFAAQAIPCIRELKMDPEKVNPNGGAISLGHPLGATGAILTCKALSHLERTGEKYALITMCIGGGMGAAGIFEMLK